MNTKIILILLCTATLPTFSMHTNMPTIDQCIHRVTLLRNESAQLSTRAQDVKQLQAILNDIRQIKAVTLHYYKTIAVEYRDAESDLIAANIIFPLNHGFIAYTPHQYNSPQAAQFRVIKQQYNMLKTLKDHVISSERYIRQKISLCHKDNIPA